MSRRWIPQAHIGFFAMFTRDIRTAIRVSATCLLAATAIWAQTPPVLKMTRTARLRTPSGANLISHGIVSDPSILYDGGRYRMWFTSVVKPYTDQQQMGIAYAESTDGIVWTPRLDSSGSPILLVAPTPGGWDGGGIETASVVRTPQGKYLMYYSGDKPPAGTHSWAIGLATSDDGITWTKFGNGPVLEGRGGWEGPFTDGGVMSGGVCEPSVIYDAAEGLFKMWFSALGPVNGKSAFRMGYATSPNGFDWEMHPTAVMDVGVTSSWDDLVVSHVNVSRDARGQYHAFYFGTSAANYLNAESRQAAMVAGSIGYAISSDGINWTKATRPVLSVVSRTWQAWTIGGPCALIENGVLKLWYFGSATYNTYVSHMGLATAPLP